MGWKADFVIYPRWWPMGPRLSASFQSFTSLQHQIASKLAERYGHHSEEHLFEVIILRQEESLWRDRTIGLYRWHDNIARVWIHRCPDRFRPLSSCFGRISACKALHLHQVSYVPRCTCDLRYTGKIEQEI